MGLPAFAHQDQTPFSFGLLHLFQPRYHWDNADARPRTVPTNAATTKPTAALAAMRPPPARCGSETSRFAIPDTSSNNNNNDNNNQDYNTNRNAKPLPAWPSPADDAWLTPRAAAVNHPVKTTADAASLQPPSWREQQQQQRPLTPQSLRATAYSLYPAPTKPLPPIPLRKSRLPSADSSHNTTTTTSTRSLSRVATGDGAGPESAWPGSWAPPPSQLVDIVPPSPPPTATTTLYRTFSQQSSPAALSLHFWKTIGVPDKKTTNTAAAAATTATATADAVYYLDFSPAGSVLTSKHGKNRVRLWSVASGKLLSAIKISSYTEARSRSREYLIRSHAVLSESGALVAVATRFGRSLEIYNWTRKKSVQSVGDVDRWAAAPFDMFDGGDNRSCPLAVYRADSAAIDLYTATRDAKRPLRLHRTISLDAAGLPFIPDRPELAVSATSPLLVAAAGPRPPTSGHPPSRRETLLVAWETSSGAAADVNRSKPYRVVCPYQHLELETAIPYSLMTYGSVVVSIWIPASFRAVPASTIAARRPSAASAVSSSSSPISSSGGYNLVRTKVPNRYVLVWDLSANSTRTIAIPNCTACISPDCRLVAYCDATGSDIGARGSLVILDVITGDEVWCWPDKDSSNPRSETESGFGQFASLGNVTELAFSADGRFLVVADNQGRMGIYDIHQVRG